MLKRGHASLKAALTSSGASLFLRLRLLYVILDPFAGLPAASAPDVSMAISMHAFADRESAKGSVSFCSNVLIHCKNPDSIISTYSTCKH